MHLNGMSNDTKFDSFGKEVSFVGYAALLYKFADRLLVTIKVFKSPHTTRLESTLLLQRDVYNRMNWPI